MYRQLYESVRRQILAGDLAPGQRVPSTRSLAQHLGVSRNTVAQTYNQLLSEGYFQTTVGSGTFVCNQIPAELIEASPLRPSQTQEKKKRSLSTYGKSLAEFNPFSPPDPQASINFRYGRPALDEFPLSIWRQLLSRYCRSKYNTLDYNLDLLGYRPLREAIASYLGRSRQVNCTAEQIIIVSGSQQAIDLTSRIFLEQGDAAAIENPGYLGARQAFSAQGAIIYPISVDTSGIVVDELHNNTNQSVKLIYVTPSHQFPTGAIMSLARRIELLAWAKSNNTLIIEDDYDSEYRYVERPIPALKELDNNNSVLYMGTFSKILFPALRIGYLVLPPDLVNVFSHAKWIVDRQAPLLEQYVVTDFINEGHLERHIRRMRSLYDQRRKKLVNALHNQLGKRVSIMGENAGMHVMLQLKTRLSDADVVERARQAGVGITCASPYYLGKAHTGQFILGYTEMTESKIEKGVEILSQAIGIR